MLHAPAQTSPSRSPVPPTPPYKPPSSARAPDEKHRQADRDLPPRPPYPPVSPYRIPDSLSYPRVPTLPRAPADVFPSEPTAPTAGASASTSANGSVPITTLRSSETPERRGHSDEDADLAGESGESELDEVTSRYHRRTVSSSRAGSVALSGLISYESPCETCTRRKIPCQGYPGKACTFCNKAKTACNKSALRKKKAAEAAAAAAAVAAYGLGSSPADLLDALVDGPSSPRRPKLSTPSVIVKPKHAAPAAAESDSGGLDPSGSPLRKRRRTTPLSIQLQPLPSSLAFPTFPNPASTSAARLSPPPTSSSLSSLSSPPLSADSDLHTRLTSLEASLASAKRRLSHARELMEDGVRELERGMEEVSGVETGLGGMKDVVGTYVGLRERLKKIENLAAIL